MGVKGVDRLLEGSVDPFYTRLFEIVNKDFFPALKFDTDQFFFNIDHYLHQDQDFTLDLSEHCRNYLYGLALPSNPYHDYFRHVEDFVDSLSPTYLAILSVLNSFVVVGIDMESPNLSWALYTRSLQVLTSLQAQGRLQGDMDRLVEVLTGPKLAHSLKNANFSVVRLDLDEAATTGGSFKAEIPRSNLDIGLGKRHVVIPVPFFYLFEDLLKHIFRGDALTFSKDTAHGSISHHATLDPAVLTSVYAQAEPGLLQKRISRIRPGYDPLHHRFYLYDLESSIYSPGIVSFRPELLNSLTHIPQTSLDTSMHQIDFTLLRAIFRTKVSKLRREQLDSLGLLDLSSYANMKDKLEALLRTSDSLPDKTLFSFMSTHVEVFGSLEQALEKRQRVTPRFLKNFHPVSLADDPQQRLDQVNSLMASGVVRFTARKKDGAVYEKIVSNNPTALERRLGPDYIKKFESIRGKLYRVKDLILSGKVTSVQALEQLGVEYNLLDYLDLGLFFNPAIAQGDTHPALTSIDDAIEVLKQKMTNRNMAPGTMIYRNLEATDPRSFFGNLDVSNLVSVEYAEL